MAIHGLSIMLSLNNMELYVVFGLPGAGKTYIGKLFAKYFGFYFYDGDQDMPQQLKDAIVSETVTDQMRDAFFDKLIASIRTIQNRYPKIVVSQTFIKEKYRKQFLTAFPNARFIYIDAKNPLREKRLLARDSFRLPLEKWQKMSTLFEKPHIKHMILQNNHEGEEEIKKQLQLLIK